MYDPTSAIHDMRNIQKNKCACQIIYIRACLDDDLAVSCLADKASWSQA